MRVLVVDDSATNLLLLSQMVRSVGGIPLSYTDPVRALEEVPGLNLDMALVDYEMPRLDGVGLINGLREAGLHDIPIVMVTASEQTAVRYAALDAGATDFLRKPVDPVEVKARLKNLFKLRETQNELRDRCAGLADEVLAATRELLDREEEIIYRLSRAAEYRDTDTGAHIARMASYCRLIAEALGLDQRQCRSIYLAAPMHDIGKIAVADSILLKPGRLTDGERALMELHTLHGHKILADSKLPLIRQAAEIAVSHHERWDGTGYPKGLRGTEIPLFARIAAIADVFDALTSERPYKPAWSADKAKAYIIEGSGTHFDPACVEAFCSRWSDVITICTTEQKTTAA
jgi:putative two-component system response regulator